MDWLILEGMVDGNNHRDHEKSDNRKPQQECSLYQKFKKNDRESIEIVANQSLD